MGVNWRHYYERSIRYLPIGDLRTAYALRHDGPVRNFILYNGQFK
jgi:hypothetical protein